MQENLSFFNVLSSLADEVWYPIAIQIDIHTDLGGSSDDGWDVLGPSLWYENLILWYVEDIIREI